MFNIADNKFYKYKISKEIAAIMGVKAWHIVLPIALSFMTGLLEGTGVGLLIPLVQGVAANNYSFALNVPVLKNVIGIFYKQRTGFSVDNRRLFLIIGLLIFLTAFFKLIIEYGSRVFASYWNGVYSKRMRVSVFNRFLGFGKLYLDKVGQSYVNTVISYSEQMLALLNLIQDTIRESFYIIINLSIMCAISWRLLLFTLCLLPISNFILSIIVKKIRKLANLDNRKQMDLNQGVFNILSCIPLIKVYSKEKQMSKNFEEAVENLRGITYKKARLENLLAPIHDIVVLLSLLLMIAFVAFVVAQNKTANIAIFIVFLYQARVVLPKFSIFQTVSAKISGMVIPIKEVVNVLEDEGKVFVAEGTRDFAGLVNHIEINHLNFSYIENRLVLKDVNCFIEKGKMTAVIGSTGSGKSTLVNLILRLYDSPPGSIKVDGIDIREFKLASLRSHMSIVTQGVFLFNDSIRNNVSFGLDREANDDEILEALKKARLYDFVIGLPKKLETSIGDRGIKLSGGEQQRLSIARALLRGAEILLLDEATSSLDTKTERLIQQSIDEAVKGKTTVVIAHRLSTIKNADKIIVLEGGRLVEQGSLNELVEKKGKFYEHWEAQKFY